MTHPDNPLAAALEPLISRVRTDVTAVKRPEGGSRWTTDPLTPERIARHLNGGPARGVCLIKPGESVTLAALLDFDSHHGEVSWPEMSEVVGRVADALVLGWGAEPLLFRSSGGRGVHLYLLWDVPQDARSVRQWLAGVLRSVGLRSGTKGVGAGEVEVFPKQNSVEVGGFGNQAILPLAGESVLVERCDLSGLLIERGAVLEAGDWRMSPAVPVVEASARAATAAKEVGEGAAWRAALDALPNGAAGPLGEATESLGYDDWRNVVFAIHHETGGSEDGLALAQEWSSRSDKHDEAFLAERVWPYVRSEGGRGGPVVTGGTVMSLAARLAGWTLPLDDSAFAVVPEARTGGAGVDVGAVAAVERRGIPQAKHLCTDQANANRLVKAYGSRVLVAAGRWHVWDGVRWKADEADVYRYACRLSEMVRDEAREVRRRARERVEGDGSAMGVQKADEMAEALDKWSSRCESKGTIEAAIGLARKMLTVDAEVLDRDPWLLNVRNGVVDLRTGELRGHRAEDYITKLADVEYRGVDWRSDLWEQAVEVISGREVSEFLRRWFGYCATGLTREQVFVVHWGDGANGKSTVLDTVGRVLGDYAGVAAPGLVAGDGRGGDRHPTEIAALWGRRMVTAHESREGVQLREDFVKQATGGDRLVARFMREDFFEFAPTHKLQLLTNAKPVVKGQDHGVWRRVRLVAYSQRFGSAEDVAAGRATGVRDVGLMGALGTDEVLSGVLSWIVRGAVEWAAGGLREPSAVLEASEDYRREQDRVGQWVSECCEVDAGGAGGAGGATGATGATGGGAGEGRGWSEPLTLGMGGLFPSYTGWCKEGGYHGLSRGRFAHELQRACPGVRIVEAKMVGETGKRRKVLQVQGIRLLPED